MTDAADAISLTVVGSSSSIPRPGRACSCYLLRGPGHAIAFDFGTGALSNLRRHMAAEDLDAVVISHMHADHFLDIVPLRYALRYGPRTNDRRVPLYLPPDGEAMLRRMTDAFASEPGADYLSHVFDVRTYDPEKPLRIGAAQLRFARTTHFVPAFAVRYECDGKSVTYSADTAPDERVGALARGTDLFLCEATLLRADVETHGRGHLRPEEAGLMARDAGVRRLLLTHYGSETSAGEMIAEAGAAFAGEISVADDGERLVL